MSSKDTSGKGSVRSKRDISERVKEIRNKQQNKQQNWLRQREDSLGRKDGERVRSASAHQTPAASPRTTPKVPASPRPGSRGRTRANPEKKFGLSYVVKPAGSSKESGYDSENSSTHQQEDYKYNGARKTGPTKAQHSSKPPVHYTSKQKGFSEWMKHRQESMEKMSQDGSSTTSTAPSEAAAGGGSKRQLDRAGSVLDRVELDTGDMSDYTVSSSSHHHHHRPHTQGRYGGDDFEDLANHIIRKVKSELHIADSGRSINNDADSVSIASSSKATESDAGDKKSRGLDNHYCAKCGKLMVAPRHDVMMLIPCGHHMCRKCTGSGTGDGAERCWHCGTDIESATNNIVLQKVIDKYRAKSENAALAGRGRRTRNDSSAGTYTPHTYTDHGNYKEDLASLQIRLEALQTEIDSITAHLQQSQRDMRKEKEQVSSLSTEEQRVREEIAALNARLGEIGTRRGEADSRLRRLEQSYTDEIRKLHSLQQAHHSLDREKEKLKILAGNQD